jgi:putative tricarboxylic transport membrane protein
MKRSEYVISGLLIAFGVFVFLTSNTIPLMVAVEKGSVVNARFFPKLMSLAMIFLAIVMAVENYVLKSSQKVDLLDHALEDASEDASNRGVWRRMTGIGIICLLYFYLFEPIGYLLSSMLFMLGFLWVLGNRKWTILLLLSVLAPVTVYVLFKILLGAPLPPGIVNI